MPPLREVNRDLLVVAITLLLWLLDLASNLMYWFTVATPADLAGWHATINPLLAMSLLLLPALVACYLAAMRIPRLVRQPVLAILSHCGLAMIFVVLVRVFGLLGYYLVADEADLASRHYKALLDAVLNPFSQFDDLLLNVTFYLLGLFILIGVNARLDLEKERMRATELHARWLDARLQTLRGQLNPHFFFNSLHTISSLLFTDVKRADKLLADLSDVMRTTLREGQREFTTVREELEYARRYLSIEETRFEDRLTIRFSVEEAALGARVPSLILQPLIENAIKHGISNSAGPHTVEVQAMRSGEAVVLEVSNDFRADASPVSPDRRMGIGLTNVRERLAAIYDEGFTFFSQGSPGGRWSARITLPYQETATH
jgi:sensor histidine kinase YesM